MLTVKSSFKNYEADSKNPIERKEYIEVADLFHKFLMQKVLDGEEIELPQKLGLLSIIGRKVKVRFNEDGTPRGLSPNWGKTKALWARDPIAKENKQRVFNLNQHTSGVRYRFHWSKLNVTVPHKTLYSLRLSRENKRAVNRLVVEEGKEYIIKI